MSQNFTKEKIKTNSSNNSSDDLMSLEDKLFNYIESSDVEKIKKILSLDNIKFWEFLDHEDSTVLIKLAYADLEIVFNYIQILIENLNEKQLKIYINKKSQNGFTALHYASFRGNVNLCEKLIENHADINLINNNGLNVIHMAAQGDQPATLILFKEKYKIDPQINDNVLSSSLHWAAYMGSDLSIDFLASWDHFIDKKDKDGFTPLHLAVMTDRIKIAKKLLKLGSNPECIDNKNRRPVDIARQKNFKSMEDLLNDENNLTRCHYNIKQAKRNNFYPFLFLGYFLVKEFFTVFTISFYVDSNKLILLSLMSNLVLFILNCILLFHNPSLEKKKIEKTLLLLVITGENLKNVCPFCHIRKSISTHHCYFCNKCIEKYDHHCIWLSNCIGKYNIFTFRVFLIWILFKIIVNLTISFKNNVFVKVAFPLFQLFTNFRFKQLISSLDIITGIIVFIPVIILLYENIKHKRPYTNKMKNDEKTFVNKSENEHVYLINK